MKSLTVFEMPANVHVNNLSVNGCLWVFFCMELRPSPTHHWALTRTASLWGFPPPSLLTGPCPEPPYVWDFFLWVALPLQPTDGFLPHSPCCLTSLWGRRALPLQANTGALFQTPSFLGSFAPGSILQSIFWWGDLAPSPPLRLCPKPLLVFSQFYTFV